MSGKKKRKKISKVEKSKKTGWPRYAVPAGILLLAALVVVMMINDAPGEETPAIPENGRPVAAIEMEDGGQILVELDPQAAPNTVRNFIYLAEQGFYDGLLFHRVIDNFMIQGGCPEGTGTGGPGYRIKGEFAANDHQNSLRHERGVISMARSQPFDSAGSQFFITVAEVAHLDDQYAAFGKVIEGMDVVDRISLVDRNPANDRPLEDQLIRVVTVETHGIDYGSPEKL